MGAASKANKNTMPVKVKGKNVTAFLFIGLGILMLGGVIAAVIVVNRDAAGDDVDDDFEAQIQENTRRINNLQTDTKNLQTLEARASLLSSLEVQGEDQTLEANDTVEFLGTQNSSGQDPPLVSGSVFTLKGPNRRYMINCGAMLAAFPTGGAQLVWQRNGQTIEGTNEKIFDTHSMDVNTGGATEFGSYMQGSFVVETENAFDELVWRVNTKDSPNFIVREPRVFITELL